VPADSFVTNDGERLNLVNKVTGESVAPLGGPVDA
jgi:hypothetical protein